MAIASFSLCLVLHNDVEVFTINNTTVYGTVTPDRRLDGGEVLIVAYVDSDEVETFATIDSTPYLSKLSYDVSNSLDGHYRAELLRFNLYDNTLPYHPEIRDTNLIITTYANVIYYPTTGKFYKNILASTGIAPDAINGGTYWQAITDFTNSELRTNTNLQIGIYDTIADARGRKDTKNTLYKILARDYSCIDDKVMLNYRKKRLLLIGAQSRNNDGQPEQGEVITRILENLIEAS